MFPLEAGFTIQEPGLLPKRLIGVEDPERCPNGSFEWSNRGAVKWLC